MSLSHYQFALNRISEMKALLEGFKAEAKPVGADVYTALQTLKTKLAAMPSGSALNISESQEGISTLGNAINWLLKSKHKDRRQKIEAAQRFLAESRFSPKPFSLFYQYEKDHSSTARSVMGMAIKYGEAAFCETTRVAFQMTERARLGAGRTALKKGVPRDTVLTALQLNEQQGREFLASSMVELCKGNLDEGIRVYQGLPQKARIAAIAASLPDPQYLNRLAAQPPYDPNQQAWREGDCALAAYAKVMDHDSYWQAMAKTYNDLVGKWGLTAELLSLRAIAETAQGYSLVNTAARKIIALCEVTTEILTYLDDHHPDLAVKLASSQIQSLSQLENSSGQFKGKSLAAAMHELKQDPVLFKHVSGLIEKYGNAVFLSAPKTARVLLHFKSLESVMAVAESSGKKKLMTAVMDCSITL